MQCSQLQINLQALLDEREELVQDRETYKFKVHRLNYELATLLKSKKNNIDIDALITENRYLHERLLQTQEELEATQRSLQKYKVTALMLFCCLHSLQLVPHIFICFACMDKAAVDQKNKTLVLQDKNSSSLAAPCRFISQSQGIVFFCSQSWKQF